MAVAKTCARCGAGFSVGESRRDTARYCSVFCRDEAYRALGAAQPKKGLRGCCEACGREFFVRTRNTRPAARYCSRACAGRVRNAATLAAANAVKNAPAEVRFWRFVLPEPNSGCWLWEGGTIKGYGAFAWEGGGRATHYALAMAGRPVPKGLLACHRCDNPACVNPDHLFIGTQRDNTLDMVAKGRARKSRGVCGKGHALKRLSTNGKIYCPTCVTAAGRRRRMAKQLEARAV